MPRMMMRFERTVMPISGLRGWWIVPLLSLVNLAAAGSDVRLVEAVQNQDKEAVRALLKQDVDVNTPQADGATALAWAAYWDDLDTANLLIRAGANVNIANDFGVTPLSLACTNGNAAMVETLLNAGADPNVAAFTTRETVLITAARTGNVNVVKALLAHGARVNAKTTVGQTALMWAVSERHAEVARALIESGADVHARSTVRPRPMTDNSDASAANRVADRDGGFTPLLFAARSGDLESARLLVASGADINRVAADGTTPLIVAAGRRQEALAVFLLEQGAEANAGPGYAALHAAVPAGQLRLVQALLAHGADPNARVEDAPALGSMFHALGGAASWSGMASLDGATPLWLAAKYVDASLIRALLAGGADPLLASTDQTTPLMVAAGLAQIEAPPGPRELDSVWRTPWNADAALGVVRVLVELGADINAANDAGETALHGAGYLGATSVIKFLVEQGAEVDATNELDQTPLLLAQGHAGSGGTFFSYPEAAALLLQLGADRTVGERIGYRTGEAGQDTTSGAQRPKKADVQKKADSQK